MGMSDPTLDDARAVAYDGTIWELSACLARSEGVVRSYLEDHTQRRADRDNVLRLAALERRAPWSLMERWILGLRRYPFSSQHQHLAEKAVVGIGAMVGEHRWPWLNTLVELEKDNAERDWRALLCALAVCARPAELCHALCNLGFDTSTRNHPTGISIRSGTDWLVDFDHLTGGEWGARSCDAPRLWSDGVGRYGPMDVLANDGPITRKSQIVAIAQQMKIKVPDRVLRRLKTPGT